LQQWETTVIVNPIIIVISIVIIPIIIDFPAVIVIPILITSWPCLHQIGHSFASTISG
jgi:hypothetical protein